MIWAAGVTEIALAVDPAGVRENAGASDISVTASLKPGSGTHPDPVTVPVSLPSDPSRYSSTSAQVNIPAGQVSGSATQVVTPVDNSASDGQRQVQVSGTLAGFTVTPAILTIEDDDTSPDFGTDSTTRSVPENSPSGTGVGTPVEAVDPNGDTLTYTLGGPGRHLFAIDGAGQITVRSGANPDYETVATYVLTVTATDPDSNRDTIEVTVTVTDEEEERTVNFSSSRPVVGSALVATVVDPDGDVADELWVWERSSDRTTWEHHKHAVQHIYNSYTSVPGLGPLAATFAKSPPRRNRETQIAL